MRYKRALRELRLPRPERRAARLERAAEARMRLERDWHCERSRQRLRDEAEARKYSGFVL